MRWRVELVSPPHPDVRLDHRAHAWFGGKQKTGQKGQALGRFRGGCTTKIYAKSETCMAFNVGLQAWA
jgi:hypothetical protein